MTPILRRVPAVTIGGDKGRIGWTIAENPTASALTTLKWAGMIERSTNLRREHPVTSSPGTSYPARMPAVYLSHGAPPLADDAPLDPRARRLVGRACPGRARSWSISAHWEEAPLTIGATTTVPAGLRLLGLSRALLPGDVRRARCARAGRAGAQAARRTRHRHARGAAPWARPRRLRPARRDVPGGRHPDPADLDADARPATALRDRPSARAVARRGGADHRQRLHDAQL